MDPIFQTLLFSSAKTESTNGDALPSAPCPSRYAQLIPQEALRLNNAEYAKSRDVEVVEDWEKDDEVDVYRRNEEGGLELIPQDQYDVVYLDQEEAEAQPVDVKAGDSAINESPEGEAKEEIQADAMEIDDYKAEESAAVDQDQMLYIIHKDSRTTVRPPNSDDASSTSESTVFEPTSFYNSNLLNRNISKETNLAQTLTRALVQRTEGYESIRRNFGLDEEEREEKRKKKDKKKKGGAYPGAAGGLRKRESAKSETASDDGDDDDDNNEIHQSKGHKLLSNILSMANIQDGDDLETLAQLSKMRRWQEDHIDPQMVGINLENWEDQIDWEGGVSSDEEDTKKQTAAPKEAPFDPETADCTPDFRPAEPEGGHHKRLKQTPQNPLYSDDPIQILHELRNPRLDALDLCAAVDWEGACSDSDEEYERPNIPLILQSSMAGKSIASLMAPLASSRPLPFEAHPNYQQRYDNEFTSELTAAELQSNIPGGSEALERYKEMRQKKREQMAKDKQSRVTEVMSALSLTGTGRRITSSLMGPGGAEVSLCYR